MDFLKVACARARYLGLDMEMLSIDEAAKLFPLLDKKHFVGALYNPLEGHVDPAGVTQAYAKAARDRGAEVYRFTRVTALEARADGTWDVITDKGTLRRRARRQRRRPVGARSRPHRRARAADPGDGAPVRDHRRDPRGRRLAEGNAARDRLRGRDLHAAGRPRHADRHLREGRRAVVRARDAVGFHARAAAQRSRAHRAQPRSRLPAFSGAGARGHQEDRQRTVHLRARRQSADRPDPRTCAITGSPAASWPASARAAASASRCPTGWSHGDPGFDVWAMDVARFGDWATMAYTNAKVRENYSRRFRIRFPNEELPAARPLAHDAGLRSAEGARRGVRRELRARARAVVRAAGDRSARGRHLPALERARTRRATSAARCATPSGCSRSRPSRATKSAAKAPRRGSTACSPTGCRAKAG